MFGSGSKFINKNNLKQDKCNVYEVRKIIGRGAFGTVYHVVCHNYDSTDLYLKDETHRQE
jgi:hypothetical protein